MNPTEHERRVWFHWQNLNKCEHCRRGWALMHGRAWLHILAWVIRWEWNLWSKAFHVGVDVGGKCSEELLLFKFAIPPMSFYFGIEPPCTSSVWHLAPERGREVQVAIHNWALWINPWSREHERMKADPWWVRGVTIHIDDLIWGKSKYHTDEVQPAERIVIELDGRQYHGTAKYERSTWKRPRWFAKVRLSTWIDMDPKDGLPHAGKGENSWDCGDDALCGWGVNGLDKEAAIASGIEKVLKYRRRYGNPSDVAA